jgi:hypothetical protein
VKSPIPGGVVRVNKLIAVLLGCFVVVIITGAAAQQAQAPKAPIIMKGAPMGGVKFDHTSHVKVAAKCEMCHHASKPEKPLKSPQESCTDCHTRPPTPPVTTGTQAAFHNPTATAGLCIDCHKKQNEAGKAAPTKCAECHQKVNS